MPEYLAPGVYVEEVSFRSKSIEGVSTSTTGFVGPTRFGPTDGEPELITSFNQFERIFGGLDPLEYYAVGNYSAAPTSLDNFLAHAVRAFFDNGGARLYIARAYRSLSEADETATIPADISGDGIATAPVPAPSQGIVDAGLAATAGVAAASSATGAASAAAAQAQAAALIAINTALAHIRAAMPSLPTNIDTSQNAAGILAAVQTAIDALVNGSPEETAAIAARDEADDVITDAVAARDAAAAITNAATTAQTAVSGAVAAGNSAGDAAVVPSLANAETSAATSASTANTQASTAQGAVTALNTALASLTTAQSDLEAAADPFTEADDLVTAVEAVNTAATAAVTAATNSVTPITNAARDARIGTRAAAEGAFATFYARFPGDAGNMVVTITARRGDNVLIPGTTPSLAQTRNSDLVFVSSAATNGLFIAEQTSGGWTLNDGTSIVALSSLTGANDSVSVVQFNVTVEMPGKFAQPLLWTELTVDSSRLQDGISNVFAAEISNRSRELETPLVIDVPTSTNAVELAQALIGTTGLTALAGEEAAATTVFELSGGNDGIRPDAEAYRGTEEGLVKSGLLSFEDLEDISIIAAPGVTFDGGVGGSYTNDSMTVVQALISHCQKMRYRVAVLDSPDDHSIGMVRQYRAILDTTYAALYYPWVRILDPVTRELIHVPPSGFMCGIYARNDVNIGVHKAPANEVLLGAIGLETLLNKAQQDVLNPLGINCIRYFEGRGIRIWGARTISSDPEWKYLNIRRYFVFLEHSIDRSTQWAVFEPNGPRLWENVTSAVSDFLFNEWKSGHLAGNSPKEAYFVRCDRSTMTQNDIDNGRMICLIGVAPLYPAEFVIFRIGQWTADRKA
jgi:phage tail sheath protein FI